MKFYFKIAIFFLITFFGQQEASANTVQLTKFRFSIYPDKTRLVFDVTNVINYTTIVSLDKITIDIKKAKLNNIPLNPLGLSKSLISSILSKQIGGNLYLTLNLKNPTKLQHFFLTKPNRLVLDLYPIEKKELNATLKPQQLNSESSMLLDDLEQDLVDKMYKIDENEKYGQRQVVVVIDPGHGGTDPGAIGTNGTREKDVTLAITRTLQKMINNTKGFHAVLTRNSDYFIPLRRRLGIAHSRKADMFISIHADAYINKSAHGVSVFALSQRGATSEAARWLAEKENESELGQAISDKSTLLRSVLIDLAQTATISASLEIGSRILQVLSRVASLHLRNVEQAAFVVLKSPDIPSLLVEVGFLSYSTEEMKLRNVKYREVIASKIAIGVQSYFMHHPPQGTYLAKIKQQGGS